MVKIGSINWASLMKKASSYLSMTYCRPDRDSALHHALFHLPNNFSSGIKTCQLMERPPIVCSINISVRMNVCASKTTSSIHSPPHSLMDSPEAQALIYYIRFTQDTSVQCRPKDRSINVHLPRSNLRGTRCGEYITSVLVMAATSLSLSLSLSLS